MSLAVIGCGKMGLPIAVQAASRGLDVTGVDINEDLVAAINRGESPIDEPGINNLLSDAVKSGKLKATVNLSDAVSRVNAIIVIVPVLLTDSKQADLGTIKAVTSGISRAMKPGAVVSYETTLPIGTTRNILQPLLEESGLKAEKDFYLVYSPERVKSLLVMDRLNKVPKVVGGAGPLSLEKGMKLYSAILKSELISVGTLEKAEMVKLAGMIYRDVNIALANELSRYCDNVGINLSEIIPFVNTDGEAHLLQPGIGVGGHCTPVYPYFLINDARQKGVSQSLAETARKINDGQAEYVLQRLKILSGNIEGLKILLLGLGFRPDVKEDTESSAYLIRKAVEKHGAECFLYDPFYSADEISGRGFVYHDLNSPDHIDAVILVTAHTLFLKLDWKRLREKGVRSFIDGRNCFKKDDLEEAGIKYAGIGSG
ncbi:MAG: nucleotide sugar dehydrogenase [Nitrospirae bacterium]|nr:nucleotide sugar dehydrogenase [Nitrospirota bacterium]